MLQFMTSKIFNIHIGKAKTIVSFFSHKLVTKIIVTKNILTIFIFAFP